jgi:nitroreductase
METDTAALLGQLLRDRRSVRDFRPDPVDPALVAEIVAEASRSPSWSNTQPYRVAIATGELRDRLAREYCARFDAAQAALGQGALGKVKLALGAEGKPDGDFDTHFPYPADLLRARRATGFGLYALLGIDRNDREARDRQMRRNFEFFGAPVVLFLFVHRGLREYGVLDGGLFLQSLLLAAQARGLATCAQGALATWAGPVRAAFEVPDRYALACGVSLGYASGHPVNAYDPGRADPASLILRERPRAP